MDSTQEAVVSTFGKIASVEGPGLHFKAPFIQSVTMEPTKTLTTQVSEVRGDCTANGAPVGNGSGGSTYTLDQQEVFVQATAQYTLDASAEGMKLIVGHFPNYQATIDSLFAQSVKATMGQYNTVDVPDHRAAVAQSFEMNLQANILKEGIPANVINAQLNQYDASCSYVAGIEAASTLKTQEQGAKTQAIIAQTNAEAEVNAAQGDKTALTLRAEGAAAGLAANIKAAGGPENYIRILEAQRWNGANSLFAGGNGGPGSGGFNVVVPVPLPPAAQAGGAASAPVPSVP